MTVDEQIEIGDVIADAHGMVQGPVIGEAVYPLKTKPPVPCWVIRNSLGLEQKIFKWASVLVRKGGSNGHKTQQAHANQERNSYIKGS